MHAHCGQDPVVVEYREGVGAGVSRPVPGAVQHRNGELAGVLGHAVVLGPDSHLHRVRSSRECDGCWNKPGGVRGRRVVFQAHGELGANKRARY